MNPTVTAPSNTAAPDEDMAEQANPGHGIPSQDPSAAAQTALAPHEAEREANSVLMAGGMAAGAATGAVIGVAVAGPMGILVGATLGAVAGAVGGGAAGNAANVGEAVRADAVPVGAPTSGSTSEATTDPVHLHIEDTGGDGRPVVLIHGWPLSAQAWAPQVPVLQAAGYRVVAYDLRGVGRSDKPVSGYSYDTLADDLERVMDQCGLQDVTLVGFSMGGGEVARYVGRHGESRLHSVVFAAAVPPYLLKTPDNPEGPLPPEKAEEKKQAFKRDRIAYFDQFTANFFSADGALQVTQAQRAEAIALCQQSAPHAALACMESFATTDFRGDLKKVTVPTLVIHGEADAVVPLEGSGQRTHRAVPHSQLVTVPGAPHGLNLSHAQAFNNALLAFLRS
jgi:non-heme chloroperoxidase